LQWWQTALASPTANAIKMQYADCSIDTDASPWAWGGFLHGMPCGGFWDASERLWSSNRKEMMGIFRALQHFVDHIRGLTVLVQTDNTTCVSYLQEDIRAGNVDILSKLALRIWHFCQRHSIVLRVVHLPGK
jgi:ribonuclease HI